MTRSSPIYQSDSSQASNRFFTASNLLSVSRALLTIPFAMVMLGRADGYRVWGGAIILLAALTDKFDGVLARKLNQITDWGKILDPLADKICAGVVAIVLLVMHDIPVWFVVVILSRDVLIFVGGIYVKTKKSVLLQSNETGKWTMGVVALALFLMVLGAQSILIEIAVWASVVLLAVSLALYVKRFNEVMKG